MIRKHIEHLAIESLKYFFNLDHALCNHLFLTILVAVSIFKLTIDNVGRIFHNGLLTVREDLNTIKTYITILVSRVEKAGLYESAVKRANRFTTTLSEYITAAHQ